MLKPRCLTVALYVVLLPQQVSLAISEADACNASALLQAAFTVSSGPTRLAKEGRADVFSLLSYASIAARSREVLLSAAASSTWLRFAHRHSHEDMWGPLIVFSASIILTTLVAACWVSAWRARARLSCAGGVQAQADGLLEPRPMEIQPGLPEQKVDGADWTVRWLRVLVIATFALLGVQATLGALAKSVTLLGDLGHTASDAVSYLFASVVEAAKADLGRRGTAILDVLSAVFSILVVCCSSFCATELAIRRLKQVQQDDTAVDFGLIGFALFGFAVISTCVNAGILLMHMWYKPKPTCEQASVNDYRGSAPPETRPRETPSPGLPRPPCRQADHPLNFSKKGDECVPCSAGSGSASSRQSTQRRFGFIRDTSADGSSSESAAPTESNKAWIKSTVHALVHPGCAGQCRAGQQEAGGDEKHDIFESLNEYGVLLHLGSDVVRSMVIFVTGVLVIFKVIPSPSAADAITSLIVVSCVLAGSLIIVTRMPRSLYDAIYG